MLAAAAAPTSSAYGPVIAVMLAHTLWEGAALGTANPKATAIRAPDTATRRILRPRPDLPVTGGSGASGPIPAAPGRARAVQAPGRRRVGPRAIQAMILPNRLLSQLKRGDILVAGPARALTQRKTPVRAAALTFPDELPGSGEILQRNQTVTLVTIGGIAGLAAMRALPGGATTPALGDA